MKWTLIVIGAFIVLAGGIIIASNDSPSGATQTQAQAKQFSGIQEDMTSGATLIDVRTAAEFDAGHIAGSENLTLQDIQAGSLPEVDKAKKVYVYCQSGNRSAQATAILTRAGYSVEDLGGIGQVIGIGGKVIK